MTARPWRVLLCALALTALVACEKASRGAPPPPSAPASARPDPAPVGPRLAALPDALPTTLGPEWDDDRAAGVAANVIQRSTQWPALGLCREVCRVGTGVLVQGEDPGSGGSRHLVVLNVFGSEMDGAGGQFVGTAIAVCSFERRSGLWTLADCRQDAARLPHGYGGFDELVAAIRADADAGTSIAVEWAKSATGEQDRSLALLRRVDGRFADVLDLDIGEDTNGNYADRPDVQASWKATWAFQKISASQLDIIATALGQRGGSPVDCRARFHFDGRRYRQDSTSAGPEACPWASRAPPESGASAASAPAAASATSAP